MSQYRPCSSPKIRSAPEGAWAAAPGSGAASSGRASSAAPTRRRPRRAGSASTRSNSREASAGRDSRSASWPRRAARTSSPTPAARSPAAASSADLPIPAPPSIRTSAPSPRDAAPSTSAISPSSRSRSTSPASFRPSPERRGHRTHAMASGAGRGRRIPAVNPRSEARSAGRSVGALATQGARHHAQPSDLHRRDPARRCRAVHGRRAGRAQQPPAAAAAQGVPDRGQPVRVGGKRGFGRVHRRVQPLPQSLQQKLEEAFRTVNPSSPEPPPPAARRPPLGARASPTRRSTRRSTRSAARTRQTAFPAPDPRSLRPRTTTAADDFELFLTSRWPRAPGSPGRSASPPWPTIATGCSTRATSTRRSPTTTGSAGAT